MGYLDPISLKFSGGGASNPPSNHGRTNVEYLPTPLYVGTHVASSSYLMHIIIKFGMGLQPSIEFADPMHVLEVLCVLFLSCTQQTRITAVSMATCPTVTYCTLDPACWAACLFCGVTMVTFPWIPPVSPVSASHWLPASGMPAQTAKVSFLPDL